MIRIGGVRPSDAFMRPRLVVVLALLSLAAGLMEALFLVLVTRMAFDLADPSTTTEIVLGIKGDTVTAGLIGCSLILAKSGCGSIAAAVSANVTSGAVAEVRRKIAEGFLSASLSHQRSAAAGRLQELLTSYSQRVAELAGAVAQAIASGLNLLAMLILAAVVNPNGSAIALASVAVLALVVRPMRSAVRRRSARAASTGMAFASTLAEISELGLEVRTFGVQRRVLGELSAKTDEHERAARSLSFTRLLVPVVFSGVAYFAVVAGLVALAGTSTENAQSIGAVMLIMLRSLSYAQNLQTALASVASSSGFAAALTEEADILDSNKMVHGDAQLDRVRDLTFSDVSFGYNTNRDAISAASFELHSPSVVGVVGESGSGKTTLSLLMLGLLRPISGDVLVNGRSIKEYRQEDWVRRVTYVPQAQHFISGSIADNIRFFRPWVTDAQVEEAASAAQLSRDAANDESFLKRIIDARGTGLSGGQAQRVGIARALVERPSVIVLDEPTSALDGSAEHELLQVLANLGIDTLVVIVTHRSAVLQICEGLLRVSDARVHFAARSETNTLFEGSDGAEP